MAQKGVSAVEKPQYEAVSALEMAGAVAAGEVSPVEWVQQSLERIETHNRSVNAFSQIFADDALAQAREREAEALRGELRGPLHGVPVAIKDLFQTKGRRTTRGSRAFRDAVGTENAPIVERLEASGAICVGKTTTTEFGWTAASTSELFGPTRNPWDTRLTSGGSSSGSGAAVAARMVPLALGSDGGGSVRIPAAFCGIYSMKGSLGRISVSPWSATEMLSHSGPMTVDVMDSAAAFQALKGPDARDHGCLPADPVNYVDRARAGVARPRVAYAPTLFGCAVDPEIASAVAAAAARIADDMGAEVEEVTPKWEDPLAIFETIWVGGRGTAYGKLVREHLDELDPGFASLVEKAQGITLADHLQAMQQRAAFCREVHTFFDEWDFLILPSVPILPFAAERTGPVGHSDEGLVPWARWTPFSYPFNLTGNPAASIPCGWSSSGLPIGLQIVGPRFQDAEVLSLSAAYEHVQPWRERIPVPAARE